MGHHYTCTMHVHDTDACSPATTFTGFIVELLFLIFDLIVLSFPLRHCFVCVFDRASWVLLAHQAPAGNQDHRLALALMEHFSSQVGEMFCSCGRFIIKIS